MRFTIRCCGDVRFGVQRTANAEASAATSRRQLADLYDLSHDALVKIDDDGAVIEFNPQAERTFGWSRAEALRLRVSDLLPGDDLLVFQHMVSKLESATLGDAVSDVRASDRLTESAVCLVAPEGGPDRQIERMLSAAGRLEKTTRPVLEINPAHKLVVSLAGAKDETFRTDAAHLLLDEARVLDGDRPADPQAFSERLARLLSRAMTA